LLRGTSTIQANQLFIFGIKELSSLSWVFRAVDEDAKVALELVHQLGASDEVFYFDWSLMVDSAGKLTLVLRVIGLEETLFTKYVATREEHLWDSIGKIVF